MSPKEWAKTVTDTADVFPYSSFNYLEGPPIDSMKFAGMEAAHVIQRAYVEPYGAESVGLLCHGGLSDRNGLYPTFVYHLRVNKRAQFVVAGRRPHASIQPVEADYIPGRWLYGGELMHHFGHFMAESSHRAYALTDYYQDIFNDQLDGIIFASRMALKDFARDLFCGYYGIPEEKIRIVKDTPAIVEHLVVRPQGSIIGGSPLSADYTEFLTFHQKRNAQEVKRDFPRRLFIGRAHLTTGGGGISAEHVLESRLVEHGFTSIRPEEYPLLEQIEMLRQAEMVVGIGGSFVHLYDHLGKTEASMFLISRGDSDAFYHDRTVRNKVANLEYYTPDADRGDSIDDGLNESGRRGSITTYNMDLLLENVGAFIKAHMNGKSSSVQ